MPQVAVAKILTESVDHIFKKDSVELDSHIYMHRFKASFVGDTTYYELQLDSVEARFTNDTTLSFRKIHLREDVVVYDEVTPPTKLVYSEEDTLWVHGYFEYSPNRDFTGSKVDMRCLKVDYILLTQEHSVTRDKFKTCSMGL